MSCTRENLTLPLEPHNDIVMTHLPSSGASGLSAWSPNAKRLGQRPAGGPERPASELEPGPIDFASLHAARQRRKLISPTYLANKLGLRVSGLESNPHRHPGTEMYARFVSAWERVPDKTLKICYHGTRIGQTITLPFAVLSPAFTGFHCGSAGAYHARH